MIEYIGMAQELIKLQNSKNMEITMLGYAKTLRTRFRMWLLVYAQYIRRHWTDVWVSLEAESLWQHQLH